MNWSQLLDRCDIYIFNGLSDAHLTLITLYIHHITHLKHLLTVSRKPDSKQFWYTHSSKMAVSDGPTKKEAVWRPMFFEKRFMFIQNPFLISYLLLLKRRWTHKERTDVVAIFVTGTVAVADKRFCYASPLPSCLVMSWCLLCSLLLNLWLNHYPLCDAHIFLRSLWQYWLWRDPWMCDVKSY